jgi:hypothetical protein
MPQFILEILCDAGEKNDANVLLSFGGKSEYDENVS